MYHFALYSLPGWKIEERKKGTKKESWFVLEPIDCHLQWLWCSLECRQQTKDNLGSYRQCDKIVIIFLWLVAIASPTCCLSISHYIYCRDQQWRCCWGDQLFKLFCYFRPSNFLWEDYYDVSTKRKRKGWISQPLSKKLSQFLFYISWLCIYLLNIGLEFWLMKKWRCFLVYDLTLLSITWRGEVKILELQGIY